jgi:hypothetical protein
MFKCYQHATNDFKIYVGLIFIIHFVENYHMDQKSGKGWQKWHKTCMTIGVPPQKFKTMVKILFASQIILF